MRDVRRGAANVARRVQSCADDRSCRLSGWEDSTSRLDTDVDAVWHLRAGFPSQSPSRRRDDRFGSETLAGFLWF